MLPMVKGIRRRNRKLGKKKRRMRNPQVIRTVQRILMRNVFTKDHYRLPQHQH